MRTIKSQMELLNAKYKEDIVNQSQTKEMSFKQLRSQYERKMEELQQIVQKESKRVSELHKERKRLASELDNARTQLERATKEIEGWKKEIDSVSQQNQVRVEQEGRVVRSLKEKLDEQQRQLQFEQTEKEKFAQKAAKKQHEIEILQNMMSQSLSAAVLKENEEQQHSEKRSGSPNNGNLTASMLSNPSRASQRSGIKL